MNLKFSIFFNGYEINLKQFYDIFNKKNDDVFLILHGLFGRRRNWYSIAKVLSLKISKFFFTIDLRNHGENPPSDEISYDSMVQDLYSFVYETNLEKVSLIGHSMGGKVSMLFALCKPSIVKNLIIVDIAPKKYKLNEFDHIDFLIGLDLDKIKSRSDANILLSKHIKEEKIRLFLLQNLISAPDFFKWSFNLNTLKNGMLNLRGFPIDQARTFKKSVLCLYGEKSQYVRRSDFKYFKPFFPNIKFEMIQNAGHWLHQERSEIFIKKIYNYLVLN